MKPLVLLTLLSLSQDPHAAQQRLDSSVNQPLERLKRENPKAMILRNERTGYVRSIYGLQWRPNSDLASIHQENSRQIAEEFLAENHDLFGVDPSQLQLQSVNGLSLQNSVVSHAPAVQISDKVADADVSGGAGTEALPRRVKSANVDPTRNKFSVKFFQVIEGIEVRDSFLVMIFLNDGTLVAVDSKLAPSNPSPWTLPTISKEFAQDQVKNNSEQESLWIGEPKLVLVQNETLRLAWEVSAGFKPNEGGLPEEFSYLISADRSDSEILEKTSLVHHQRRDTIRVMGPRTPGLASPLQSPSSSIPLPGMIVTSPQSHNGQPGYTDENGEVTWFPVGQGDPGGIWQFFVNLNPTVFTRIAETTTQHATTAGAIPHYVTLQFPQSDLAAVNVHHWLRQLDAYLYEWDLDYGTNRDHLNLESAFPIRAFVNENLNASGFGSSYYRSSDRSLHFGIGGGDLGVPGLSVTPSNSAYSTLIIHEAGHLLNQLYGSLNGNDGFGEGAADAWALYVCNTINGNTSDSQIGRGYYRVNYHNFPPHFFSRTSLFTGVEDYEWLNTPYCGEGNSGCYRDNQNRVDLHRNGAVLTGVLWKIRRNLMWSLGNAAGSARANILFTDWFRFYHDRTISPDIELHWLTLDAPDGNPLNAVNYAAIHDAFVEQGFPPPVSLPQMRADSWWRNYPPIGASNGLNVLLVHGWQGHSTHERFFASESGSHGSYMVDEGLGHQFRIRGYNVYDVNIPEGTLVQKGADLAGLMPRIANHARQSNQSARFIGVGHSMGGLTMESAYLQFNCGQYFSQIITLATPFYGSPSGDYLDRALREGDIVSVATLVVLLAQVVGGTGAAGLTAEFIQNNFDSAEVKAFLNSGHSLSVAYCSDYQDKMRRRSPALYNEFTSKLYCVRATTDLPEDIRFIALRGILLMTLYGAGVGDGVVPMGSASIAQAAHIITRNNEVDGRGDVDHSQARRPQHIWLDVQNMLGRVDHSRVRVGPGGYTTITEAVQNVQTGGRISIQPGSYRELLQIVRAMTLENDGSIPANVRIGPDR